ncbi:hypothetical protein [Nocardia beijingensis]|uniref:hypothetical protein n=1 Tax=Nocardia beijingensis TaxID=95162 RepID=UPI001E54C3DD|nr:hypothetical protein [Nocardia beijingensis]
MSAKFEVVKGFYAATQTGDGPGILALLHPEFEARTAPGLPCGAGGVFHGPLAVMTRVWGAVAREFDTAPYDET